LLDIRKASLISGCRRFCYTCKEDHRVTPLAIQHLQCSLLLCVVAQASIPQSGTSKARWRFTLATKIVALPHLPFNTSVQN